MFLQYWIPHIIDKMRVFNENRHELVVVIYNRFCKNKLADNQFDWSIVRTIYAKTTAKEFWLPLSLLSSAIEARSLF